MTTDIPIYEAKILGTDNTGIFAMSFVDIPANECNFVALARSAARPVKMKLNPQKQLLTGVVLVPNQMIYRHDTQLGEYYIRFSAEEIEKIRDKMMQNGAALSTTTHMHEKPLRGNHLVECWIVEDPKNDKALALGLGELKKGTLVATYKVGNASYWRSHVMAGKVKGFSLEGLFNFKTVKMAKTAKTAAPAKKTGVALSVSNMLKGIATLLEGDTAADAKDLADVAKVDETNSGVPVIIFELQDGTEIDVDSEGFCTIDETQAPAGDHLLADGNTISIGDDGYLVETTEEPAEEATEEAATALRAAAKAKAKEAVKLFAKPKVAQTPRDKEIAKLQAQIATLKKEPSTKPAAPKVDGGGDNVTADAIAQLKGHQRAALMLRARNERK